MLAHVVKSISRKHIWIVGSPRSGTTFLTHFIGSLANKTYDEPNNTHRRDRPQEWKFPDVPCIVFKYCENWRIANHIVNLFPASYFVHIIRNPDDVVSSMAFPRKDSYPSRNLFGQMTNDKCRTFLSMKYWYEQVMGAKGIKLITPNYHEIRYESLADDETIRSLSQFVDLPLKPPCNFKNRNRYPEIDWTLTHPHWRHWHNLRDELSK